MPRPTHPDSGTGAALVYRTPLAYARGTALQGALHAARREERIPDTLVLMQHAPVITLGRRGRDGFLLRTPDALAAMGIEVHTSSRGGDVTYHGPGQWVIYPILRLGSRGADAHGHLWNLEELSIRTCADFGVEAWRRDGKSGAWTDAGKIAAIGFAIRRWVTLHGTSFNVDPRPDGFAHIVPCGLVGEPVASLRACLGAACPSMDRVAERLLLNADAVFDRAWIRMDADGPLPEPYAGIAAESAAAD